ncbi:MAG: type II toxin-antitoxin system HicA family toxin [Anaerolineae bacterium]|nr:type II toxin-antitoxin system HicA family toxin [Anaerolineae bacterium]
MTKLPSVSGRDCIKVLQKVGFYITRQKGSHINLRRDDPFAKTVVPDHKEIKKGTLKAILKDANLTVDEFIALL